MERVVLKAGEDRRLRRGHLWVFSNESDDLPGLIVERYADTLSSESFR